jgi:60S ribosome subunit biogenesis protein NIP7
MLWKIYKVGQVSTPSDCFGVPWTICKGIIQNVASSARILTSTQFKVWIKPNGEMPFLYGNHVVKAHVGRITEDTPEHQGVLVYNMADVPLVSRLFEASFNNENLHCLKGFGVTAKCTADTRKLDPTGIVVFHQADVGEYLREEDTLC